MPGLVNAVEASLRSMIQKTKGLRLTWGSEIRTATSRHVPFEIAQQIYLFCIGPEDLDEQVEEDMAFTPVFSVTSRWTPFILSQVCHDWRSVAFKTRQLWQSITIVAPKRCHLHRARIWMENVGNYPIDITLVQESNSDEEREVVVELMTLFAQRVSSWRKVSFTFSGPDKLVPPNLLAHCIAALAEQENPKLQHALFDFLPHPHKGSESWEVSSLVEIYNQLQKISSLVALNWSAAFTPGLKISRNLVHLDLASPISIDDLVENLVCSPQLQYLYARRVTNTIVPVYDAVGWDDDDDMDADGDSMEEIPQVVLPALLHLRVSLIGVDPTPLLDRVTLPSLVVLELLGLDAEDIQPVRQLLQVSQCSLKAFIFSLMLPTTEDQLIDWLQMEELQRVERLEVDADITDNILKMFSRPALHGTKAANRETYFPDLKDLVLTLESPGINDGTLLRMLGSRFWTPFDEPGWEKELRSARVWISPEDFTDPLDSYEVMINLSARQNQDRWRGYDDRRLEFFELSCT